MKDKEIRKKVIIGCILIGLIGLMITIQLRLEGDNKDAADVKVGENNFKEIPVGGYINTNDIKVPENAESIEDIENKLKGTDMNSDIIDKVLKETKNMIGSSQKITRYELSFMLYELIVNNDKLPDFDFEAYTLKYKDGILNEYLKAVKVVTYLGLCDFGETFDGFEYITTEEFDNAMAKLQEYLKSEKPMSTRDKLEQIREMENNKIDNNATLEYDSIIGKRDYAEDKYRDRLYSRSVAKYEQPSNYQQIVENYERIRKVDLEELPKRDYNTEQSVAFDYENLHEVFVDYDKIEILRDIVNVDNIVGVTKLGIKNIEHGEFTKEFGSIAADTFDNHSFIYATAWVGIKDNSIVYADYIYSNPYNYVLIPNDVDIDSIGFIAYKDVLEHIDKIGDPGDEMIISIMDIK